MLCERADALSARSSLTAGKLAAAGAIVALGAINYVGVRSGNLVNVVMTAAKVAGLAALPVMAIVAARVVPAFTPGRAAGSAAARGVVRHRDDRGAVDLRSVVLRHLCRRRDQGSAARTFRERCVGGIAALTTIYLAVNVAYLFALVDRRDEGRHADRRACRDDAGMGPGGAQFVALTVVLSTFGCNAAAILAGSRLLFAMASDGVFLPAARSVHPRYRTPHVAIVALTAWSAVLALSGTYEQLFTYVMFISILFSVAGGLALFRLRRTMPESSPAVPNVGISGRADRVRDRFRRVRAQHAGGAADGIARRARVSRARASGVLVLATRQPVFCVMKIAILGSGAVGGYYGAKLARAGHDVTFIARGAHLAAIRERGLEIRSPALGDFTVRAPAEEDTAKVGPVDLVIVAVKAYDNATALPMLRRCSASDDRS